MTDKLRVCVNQKVYSFLLKNQLSFTDRGILHAGDTLANHLEEIPHKTWKEKKLYWPKYCMDWKLAEGPEAKTVDAAVI